MCNFSNEIQQKMLGKKLVQVDSKLQIKRTSLGEIVAAGLSLNVYVSLFCSIAFVHFDLHSEYMYVCLYDIYAPMTLFSWPAYFAHQSMVSAVLFTRLFWI